MVGKRKIIGKIKNLRNRAGTEVGAYCISMVKFDSDGSKEKTTTHFGRWLNWDGSYDNGIDETIDYLLNARKDGWNIFAVEHPLWFMGHIELVLSRSNDGSSNIDDDILKAFEQFRTIKADTSPVEVTHLTYD